MANEQFTEVVERLDRIAAALESLLGMAEAGSEGGILLKASGPRDPCRRYPAYELPGMPYYFVLGGIYRMELLRGGRVPCSDPAQAAADLLERNDIDRALMMPQIAGAIGLFPDPNVATTIAGAMNDYFLEKWTRVDDRWRSLITIVPQDIRWSVREVERLHGEPGVNRDHRRDCPARDQQRLGSGWSHIRRRFPATRTSAVSPTGVPIPPAMPDQNRMRTGGMPLNVSAVPITAEAASTA